MLRLTAGLLLVLGVSACEDGSEARPPELWGDGVRVTVLTDWLIFDHVPDSGYTERTRQVIRAQEDWATAWPKVQYEGATEAPAVDFSTSSVIIASLGTRRDGGYKVRLGPAVVDGAVLRVLVTELTAGCSYTLPEFPYAPAAAISVPVVVDPTVEWSIGVWPVDSVDFVEYSTVEPCD